MSDQMQRFPYSGDPQAEQQKIDAMEQRQAGLRRHTLAQLPMSDEEAQRQDAIVVENMRRAGLGDLAARGWRRTIRGDLYCGREGVTLWVKHSWQKQSQRFHLTPGGSDGDAVLVWTAEVGERRWGPVTTAQEAAELVEQGGEGWAAVLTREDEDEGGHHCRGGSRGVVRVVPDLCVGGEQGE